jgi:HSP20 family protein
MNTLMRKSNGSVAPANSFNGLVDKFFQNNLNRFYDDEFWGFRGVNQSVNVPVNIRETDKSYELELVAPGLRKEDFKVSVHKDTLTISFEHQEQHNQENKNEGWLRKEYHARSFSRSFELEDTIDAGRIAAKYTDGVLQLSLPKKEGAQSISRTIEIK